ncbi:hypothetical protein ACF059_31300 [Streptomyces sp. NPDC016562]
MAGARTVLGALGRCDPGLVSRRRADRAAEIQARLANAARAALYE